MSFSESRMGTKLAGVRLLPEDYKVLEAAAREQRMSVPELIRHRLGMPLPTERPELETQLV